MTQDETYLVGLMQFLPFGARSLAKLRDHFPSYKSAYMATANELQLSGIKPKTAEMFITARQRINVHASIEALKRAHVTFVPYGDPAYPPLLSEISDPPAGLFVKGTLPSPKATCLGVVGSRRATQYGRQATEQLVGPLARTELVIVSGLAMGIDTAAHQSTISSGGTTVAVLACGVDKIPYHKQRLTDQILDHGGALVSELPLGTPPSKFTFPVRNRIISGMSFGTLVVEATEKSGSLITAREALEQNREVFAVPGQITSSNSEGTHGLLKMGARVATRPSDVLDILGITGIDLDQKETVIHADTREEASVLPHLSKQPTHADELVTRSGLSIPKLNTTLTLMEMKGKVRHVGGNYYIVVGTYQNSHPKT